MDRHVVCVVFLFVTIFSAIEKARNEKILMIPIFHTSHVNFFVTAGEALSEKGHDVTLLAHPRNKKVLNRKGVSVLYTKDIEFVIDSDNFQDKVFKPNPLHIVQSLITAAGDYCESIFTDEEMIAKLQNSKYNLVIVEGDPVGFCLYAIPYKLGVPYMSMAAIMDPWTTRVGALPSVEPYPVIAQTNEMDFFQRVGNTLAYVMVHFVATQFVAYKQNYIISKYVPERPYIDIRDLHKQSKIWLINWEPYILDYPRVSSPYYHYIGGIGTRPAKALPTELEKFVQRNDNGCIVLTFGSAIRKIPLDIMETFLDAFRQVNYNVIITNKGENPKDIPPNVKIQTWLPQNDILGHPKTKLFITHGGNNGQLEALYHGIPQIVFPVAIDQSYNGLRVEKKQIGFRMDVNDFTSQELLDNIKKITSDEKYERNAKKASQIYHSLPSSKDNIIFWVNHVLKFGADHLRPPYLDMPFYQFFMFDVLAFFLFVIAFVILVVIYIFKCCCRLCKRRSAKNKTE